MCIRDRAPTGRSAKVLSSYCNKEAHTIHKEIYYVRNNPSGNIDYSLKINKHKNTIFIVDEASMISTVKKNENIAIKIKLIVQNWRLMKCKK